jgi:hypothetical protein
VRNYNNTSGGTFSICISPLMPSGCGTAQPVGGLSLCTAFKAVYRGATSYTFRFTGTGGAAPTPFATTSATSTGLMTLSNAALALRNGGIYSVRVDANYVLPNGLGVLESPIVLQGTPCSRTIAAAPLMEVIATQRCASSTLNRSAYLRAVPSTGSSQACSATGYNFRFTRVADCAGTAIPGESPFVVSSTSAFLLLYTPFPNSTYPLPNLGYWKVEIAPVFSYGATAYGPAQIIQVNNTGASPMEPQTDNPSERMSMSAEMLSVYPNPGNGDYAVVQIDNESVISNWNIIDELGRRVEGYQVLPIDGNRYELRFNSSIANGLYYISCVSNGEVRSVRWLVSR